MIAVIRSLGRGNIEVHIGNPSPQNPARASRYVSAIHDIPAYSPDQCHRWIKAVQAIMTREQFDLVIPCSDPTQIPLQQHRKELEPHGKIYLLDDAVFKTITNKISVNSLARKAGVQLPREMVIHSANEAPLIKDSFKIPIVLKPTSSFDSNHIGERRTVQKIYSYDKLDSAIAKMLNYGPVTIQENFIGCGVGVEFLLNQGKPLLEFQHIRLHEPLHGGGSYYRKGMAVTPHLREAALAILGQLKYTGVAMAEFKINLATGNWIFIEINGRFWGSLPLAIASGADFPLALFKLIVDQQTEHNTSYRTGLCCRYWTGDFNWQLANIRADRSDPTLATRPLSTVLKETIVSTLALKERSDTLTLDDPMPGLVELRQLTSTIAQRFIRPIRRRWLQSQLARTRLKSRARIALLQAQTVLFVCKGNICRSPFAHQIAKRLFPPNRTCISAGYYPKANRPSPATAVTAAAQMGIDLSEHRSIQLTEELVNSADAIFVFDFENYERLIADYNCRHKLHLVGAMSSGPIWIDDPYGQHIDQFIATYEKISKAITTPFNSKASTS
ncbi:Low molecular weight protein-tyrosine-phosphatase wzb [Gemmata sp. SH-PL17]|uniref:arsenate reductase/protein-tyrosine-phosphatase family protein n=1 Tax=Gemmata sp. SH-PL17 TaxID=1630693 RepID=UPI00078CAFC7|nr:hypothetical protein [Gemmata sp. SH-PL17]AMV27710.1 Low molecular weight protein-tyrosine-phosphatase wzb [Gemmata sp. SH-PL17]